MSQIQRVKQTAVFQSTLRTQAEVISALSNSGNVLETRVQILEKFVEKNNNIITNSETRESRILFKSVQCDVEYNRIENIEHHVDTDDEFASSMLKCLVCDYRCLTTEEFATQEETRLK